MSIANAAHCSMMGGKSLPYKKEVEWLEGSGGAWIDTGIKFNSLDMAFRIEMSLTNNLAGEWKDEFCGCAVRDSTDVGSFRMRRYSYVNYADIGFCGSPRAVPSGFTFTCRNVGMVAMTAQSGKATGERPIGTVLATKTANPASSAPCNRNIYIFCGNIGNQAFRISTGMRLKSFTITNNGNPVSQIIPVIDNSDVRCFYDRIRSLLIYNAGQGTFLAPNDSR